MYFWFILGGKLNKYQKINLNNESNSPVPNRQTQKSKSVQTAICDAAVDSLIKLGYAKTSISGVAKKAGLSKGALQYHSNLNQEINHDA